MKMAIQAPSRTTSKSPVPFTVLPRSRVPSLVHWASGTSPESDYTTIEPSTGSTAKKSRNTWWTASSQVRSPSSSTARVSGSETCESARFRKIDRLNLICRISHPACSEDWLTNGESEWFLRHIMVCATEDLKLGKFTHGGTGQMDHSFLFRSHDI